jgi:cytochrome c oxidase subunit II
MSRRRLADGRPMRTHGVAALGGAAAVMAAAGCRSKMPTMAGASDAADRTAWLGWFMVILSAVVLAVVLMVLVGALRRNRGRDPKVVDLTDPGHRFVVIGGALLPGLVLTALFVVGTVVLGIFPARERPVYTVKVVGHQWWWEVEYLDADLSRRFTTANELHVPVGRPVQVLLTSADVIHSFWVPQLQGKLDLVPGDTNVLTLRPKRPGVYRGQCAEYCGLQHAHMALTVVADEPATFQQWLAAQRTPAQPPTDSLAALGAELFVGGPCALCHAVRGTLAQAHVAPDLTHFGSRLTIASGTLPNSLGNLEAWIANAQAIKPGVRMPPITQFTGRELRAIATYVAGLR